MQIRYKCKAFLKMGFKKKRPQLSIQMVKWNTISKKKVLLRNSIKLRMANLILKMDPYLQAHGKTVISKEN